TSAEEKDKSRCRQLGPHTTPPTPAHRISHRCLGLIRRHPKFVNKGEVYCLKVWPARETVADYRNSVISQRRLIIPNIDFTRTAKVKAKVLEEWSGGTQRVCHGGQWEERTQSLGGQTCLDLNSPSPMRSYVTACQKVPGHGWTSGQWVTYAVVT
ncbi:hypothetical protein H1C71_029128, partial [Ictidomys tridecemlineatus]